MLADLPILEGESVSFLDSHASLHYQFHHRYIVEMYSVTRKMDRALLTCAIESLFSFHDILRLRVAADESTWISPLPPEEPLMWVQITAASIAEQERQIQHVMREIYQTLIEQSGFLCRFIYFHCENEPADFFCLVVHHILADGYSMSILSHDIQRIYLQLCHQQEPHLVTQTASFSAFTQRIQRYLYQEFPAELAYWRSLNHGTTPFPVDYPERRLVHPATGETSVERSQLRKLSLALDETETRILLRTVSARGSSLEDALLAGLVRALTSWMGQTDLHVYTINNGRTLFQDVDVSNTVGYIALGAWQYFSLHPTVSSRDLLPFITEQRKRIPYKGIGLSLAINCVEHRQALWSQFCTDEDKEMLREIYFSDNVLFNYQGKELRAFTRNELFLRAEQRYQDLVAPVNIGQATVGLQRPCKLSLVAAMRDHQLWLTWEYEGTLYRASTIEALASTQIHAVRAMKN